MGLVRQLRDDWGREVKTRSISLIDQSQIRGSYLVICQKASVVSGLRRIELLDQRLRSCECFRVLSLQYKSVRDNATLQSAEGRTGKVA